MIVNTEIAQKVPQASQGALPKESSMKRTIQRERRNAFPQLSNPEHDNKLLSKWRQTESGELSERVVFNTIFIAIRHKMESKLT